MSALMMEAARTSKTSVNIYLTTRQYIPEDSELLLLSYSNQNWNVLTNFNMTPHCQLSKILLTSS
jgi:hypothetical protein